MKCERCKKNIPPPHGPLLRRLPRLYANIDPKHKLHVGRRDDPLAPRPIFRYVSKRIAQGGKIVLGWMHDSDLVPANNEKWRNGWFWQDLGGFCGRTFGRMKDALLDFERELARRRVAEGESDE